MKLERYIPELKPSRLRKNVARFWKLYIRPPKERAIFLPPEDVTQIARKVDSQNTKAQPKQVVYDVASSLAFVSCMEGKTLQIFSVGGKIEHKKDIPFEDQCVEVLADRGFVFVTTTNFERPPRGLKNKLWILDAITLEKISSVDTKGNWSKLIAIRPQGDELLISNWHSHDISVIDITDPKKPTVNQVLKWGEAPRGMAFLPEGDRLIVTGFYSGNLGILERNRQGIWANVFTSEPFDKPNYPGNMRHVLISPDNQAAIVSNLGRNLVHFWNIKTKSFEASIPVGKSPNSMCFIDDSILAVSCRNSSAVYFLDIISKKVLGRTELTGREPTGLCQTGKGILVTCFKDSTLELHIPNTSQIKG